jgi:hypothetical protein
MNVPGTSRERVIVLLIVAIVALLARFATAQLGGPRFAGRALYVLAVGCLVGCVLAIAVDNR